MFNNGYNPYFNYMQPQMPRMDQTYAQPQPQPMQQYKQPIGLQGKSVDSLDVVKAIDIPLDGSVSYFPLVDGSAIITKQLQQDGTSKMVVYKPIEEEKPEAQPKYVTPDELSEAIKKIDIKELKELREEIKVIKRQIRNLADDIKDKED